MRACWCYSPDVSTPRSILDLIKAKRRQFLFIYILDTIDLVGVPALRDVPTLGEPDLVGKFWQDLFFYSGYSVAGRLKDDS